MLELPDLQVRGVPAPRHRAVPQVRRALPDPARRPGQAMARLLARGLQLPARARKHVTPAGGEQGGPAVAAFLRYLATERAASAHTLRSYRTDLLDCIGFLARRGLGALPDADARVIRGYLADLHARELARTSIARRLATLR